jgi:hypothetical protein
MACLRVSGPDSSRAIGRTWEKRRFSWGEGAEAPVLTGCPAVGEWRTLGGGDWMRLRNTANFVLDAIRKGLIV